MIRKYALFQYYQITIIILKSYEVPTLWDRWDQKNSDFFAQVKMFKGTPGLQGVSN